MNQAAFQFDDQIDERIQTAIDGKGPWKLSPQTMAMLRALKQHRGAANPVALRDLAAISDCNPREVKAVIRSLVMDFSIAVGSSRAEPSGYYLAETAEERMATARPYIHEISSLAQRIRKLIGTQRFAELLGQMRLLNGQAQDAENP